MALTYLFIAALLLARGLLYFRIADYFNIIDRPNERSSHSTIVLRGGGVVFALSMIVWAVMMVVRGHDAVPYLPFLCGLVMICGLCLLPTGRGAFGAGRDVRWLISRRAGSHFARQRGKILDEIG